MTPAGHVAFTDTIRSIQERKGSRRAYARMERDGASEQVITPELAQALGTQTSVFLATASADGQPYVQHRGGPPGFLQVLDEHRFAFADFSGNRQFITQGNLQDNPRAQLLLVDYARRQRIKIWGTARIVEDDPALLRSLAPADYPARLEQALVFTVQAWDRNCPQHIPQRFEAADVQAALAARDERIAALEAELQGLRAR